MEEIIHNLTPILHEVTGYIFPNEVELHWGILVVLYPYLTGLVAGAFPFTARGPVAPEVANDRVFFVIGPALEVYRLSTFSLLNSVALPDDGIRRLVRWGVDGLAYIADGAVAILTTSLVTE